MVTVGWIILFVTMWACEDLFTAIWFCVGLALILGVIS